MTTETLLITLFVTQILPLLSPTPFSPQPLPKDSRWQFEVYREGVDLVATGRATQFSGKVTSSGFTADGKTVYGCSLPTGRLTASGKPLYKTAGSPFPILPFFTVIRVWCPSTRRLVYCHLIDEGPAWRAMAGTSKRGSAMIDLTRPAAKALGLREGQNANVRIRVMLGSEKLWSQARRK